MAVLITEPEKVSRDHYLLKIDVPGTKAEPGQFVNIKADRGTDPLLRRPFSVFDRQESVMTIIIRVVGKGTEKIAGMKSGEIDIIGPLGRGFTLLDNSRVLIVGGGVGNAPLFLLSRVLKERGNRITFIYGHRSDEFIYRENEFRKFADDFVIVTDDGSRGIKGFATDAAAGALESGDFDYVYTCGPVPMMEKIARSAEGRAPVEVSLESYFGCGIGLCMGCTVETGDGFKRACVDGPVMNSSIINWGSLKNTHLS